MITWVVFYVQLSYFIHRCRMVRGRYLYILGSKVKVTTELCQRFGSDTITWVVFNVQLSYFIHRCRMVWERYLYILGSKGKNQGHNRTLSTLWFSHNNLGSFQCTAFIFYTKMQDGERIWGSKGQDHNRTLSRLWFWHDYLSIFQHTASIFHT